MFWMFVGGFMVVCVCSLMICWLCFWHWFECFKCMVEFWLVVGLLVVCVVAYFRIACGFREVLCFLGGLIFDC